MARDKDARRAGILLLMAILIVQTQGIPWLTNGDEESNDMDVIFLVDGSSDVSEDDFQLLKHFLVGAVGTLDVTSESARVAIVQMGGPAQVQLYLNCSEDKHHIFSTVKAMKKLRGPRNLGTAFELTRSLVMVASHGSRFQMGTPTVVVSLVTGPPDDDFERSATILQSLGVRLAVLSVSESNSLVSAASSPTLVHSFSSFQHLQSFVESFHKFLYQPDDKAEIVFLLDVSEHEDGVKAMQTFVLQMAHRFNLGPVRLGVVVYCEKAEILLPLGISHSVEDVALKLEGRFLPCEGPTNTGAAIEFTVNSVLAPGKQDVAQSIVLITFNPADDDISGVSELLVRRGVMLFAVGVRDGNLSQLMSMVTHGGYYFQLSHAHLLTHLQGKILNLALYDYAGSKVTTLTTFAREIHQQADLVFLLDISNNVGDENVCRVIDVFAGLLSKIEVGSDKVRVALMQYTGNQESKLHFNLDTLTSNAAILRALSSMEFRKSSTPTKTSTDESFVSLFQRKSRTDVPKILILFTDGTNYGQFGTALHRLKDVNVHTFVVGVGKLDKNPLARIASSPVDKHIILVHSFSELNAAINKLTSAVRKIIHVVEVTVPSASVLPQDVQTGTPTVLVPQAELGNKAKTTVEPATSGTGKTIMAITLGSASEREPGTTTRLAPQTAIAYLPAPIVEGEIVGTASGQEIIPEVQTSPEESQEIHQQGDLVFLVDLSNNVGDDNFMKVTEFLTRFLDKLELGPSKVRVALVQYTGSGETSTTQIRFDLDTLTDKSSILSVLRDIKLINQSMPEGASAEDSLSAVFHTEGRGNVPKILILLTDGTNNDKFEAPLQRLIDTDVKTFVIGVGNVEETRLKRIVSSPDEQHLILVDNFSSLDTVIEKLTHLVDKVLESPQKVIATSAPILPQNIVNETPTVRNPLIAEINQFTTRKSSLVTTTIAMASANLGSTEEGEVGTTVALETHATLGTPIKQGTASSTIPHAPAAGVETGGTISAQEIIPKTQTSSEEMEISSTTLGLVVTENQESTISFLASTEEPILVDTASPTVAQVPLPLHPAIGMTPALQFFPEDETTTGITQEINQQGDLVFLVDFSNNIGDDNFMKVTKFLISFLDKLELGPSKVRVALVQYTGSGKTSATQIQLNLDTLTDKSSVLSVLRDIKLINESRPEGASAEDSLSAVFHTEGRGNIPKILILLTDGTNNDKFEAPLRRLIDTHVKTFVIGVGNVEETRLKRIVSSPDEQRLILVDNFSSLDTVIEKLTHLVDKVLEIPEKVIATSAPILPQNVVTETPTVRNPLTAEINQFATSKSSPATTTVSMTSSLGSTEDGELGTTVAPEAHANLGTPIEQGTASSTIPHASVAVGQTIGTTSAQEIIPEIHTSPEEMEISSTTLGLVVTENQASTIPFLAATTEEPIQVDIAQPTVAQVPLPLHPAVGTTSVLQISPEDERIAGITTLGSTEVGKLGTTVTPEAHATLGTPIEQGTASSTIPHASVAVGQAIGTTSAQEIIPEIHTSPEEMEISSTTLGLVVTENQASTIPFLAATTEEPIQVDIAQPTVAQVPSPLHPSIDTTLAPQISPEDETTAGIAQEIHQQGDLVFLVDFSNNVGDDNFMRVTKFLSGFVDKLELGPSKVRVALVQYTGSGKTSATQIRFNLDTLTDESSILSVLRDIKLINESRPDGASTADSLSAVFGTEGRGNVPKILILLTDGTNNDKFEAPLQRLIDTHVKTFVIGVGNVEETRLKRIVSSPDEQRLILVDNFSSLDTVIEKLTHLVAKVVESPEKVIATSAPILPQNVVMETPTAQNPLTAEINQFANGKSPATTTTSTSSTLGSTEEGEVGATVVIEAHATLGTSIKQGTASSTIPHAAAAVVETVKTTSAQKIIPKIQTSPEEIAKSRDLLLLIDSPSLLVSDFLLLRAALLSNLQLLLPQGLANNRLIIIQAASLPRLELALGPSANIGIDTVSSAILNMQQATGNSCNLSDAVHQGLQMLKGPKSSRDQSIILITGGPCMDISAAASMLQASGTQIFTVGPHGIYSNLVVLASKPSHYHIRLLHSFAHVQQPLFYTLAHALLGPHHLALLSSAEMMNKDKVPSRIMSTLPFKQNLHVYQKPGTDGGISTSVQDYLPSHIKEISCEDKAQDVLSMDKMVVICPGGCNNITDYKVYGQDVYSLESMVCMAGIHFGLLPPWGGWLHVSRLRVSKALLPGVSQHGVRSLPVAARNGVFFFQNCSCVL